MNLELLLARAQEIETAILNTTNQLNTLFGHKTENAHWMARLRDETESSTQVEEPVVSEPEIPVQ